MIEDIIREFLVQLRRAVLHRLLNVEDKRQFFVFDRERTNALHSRHLVIGNNDGNIVAPIAHMGIQ